MEILFILGVSALFLILASLVGGAVERSHVRSLEAREASVQDMMLTTLDGPSGGVSSGLPPQLVVGEAVISSDYFKTWLFGIRTTFGGESKTFTRLFDRARREATLRMMEQARAAGYDAVCNVRFGSADIGGNAATNGKKKTLKMAACTVTGTAFCR